MKKENPLLVHVRFLDALNEKKIPYVVITNNTKIKSEEFLESLKQKGLNIQNYIDPFSLLANTLKEKKVAAFGSDEFLSIIKDLGYELEFKCARSIGCFDLKKSTPMKIMRL
jgi:NagD protein